MPFVRAAFLCGEESEGDYWIWDRGTKRRFHCSMGTNPRRLKRSSEGDCGSCLSFTGPQNKQPTVACPACYSGLSFLHTVAVYICTSYIVMCAGSIFQHVGLYIHIYTHILTHMHTSCSAGIWDT